MVDIDAYHQHNSYMQFQLLRPDYAKAVASSIKLAHLFINSRNKINVADFCCGTGSNTKSLAEKLGGINKAILIDINKGFLEAASKSGIKAREIKIIHEDILKAELNKECEIVLSIFAYHHIPNSDKMKYLQQVKAALKKNGILILTEIYFENRLNCVRYYEDLFNSIDKRKVIPGLKDFLMQTAKSDDFEFKVSKRFADEQLKNLGFTKLLEEKIYPNDKSFEGTWVQVYKL